jgi:8-oxo-dGTP pyrophosphatase MutT (NUDIX family)
MKKQKICGFVIFCEIENSPFVLMLRRSSEVSEPLCWSFPMGHADRHEVDQFEKTKSLIELLKVAQREAIEETSVDFFKIGDILPTGIVYSSKKLDLYLFVVKANNTERGKINKQIKLNFENDDYAWIRLDEIRNLSFTHSKMNDLIDSISGVVYENC